MDNFDRRVNYMRQKLRDISNPEVRIAVAEKLVTAAIFSGTENQGLKPGQRRRLKKREYGVSSFDARKEREAKRRSRVAALWDGMKPGTAGKAITMGHPGVGVLDEALPAGLHVDEAGQLQNPLREALTLHIGPDAVRQVPLADIGRIQAAEAKRGRIALKRLRLVTRRRAG